MKSSTKTTLIPGLIAIFLTFLLLGLSTDLIIFFKWTGYFLALWIVSMPLTRLLFKDNKCLYIFGMTFGLLIPGYCVWFAGVMLDVSFSITSIAICYVLYLISNIIIYIFSKKYVNDISYSIKPQIKYFFIFYFVFLFWVYLIGFNPSAYGTEKFMDYAFLQKMLVSEILPPDDMWYSGEIINYYYGGQYYAAFIARSTFTGAEYAYNMIRAAIPALTFVGVFGIVEQMLLDKKASTKRANVFAALSATLTVFAGNMHYVVYRIVKPIFSVSESNYWFPDATRYIGYNPPVADDQTIHEFPCYSFILGDLHAHMINIMFVLVVIALLYVLLKVKKKTGECRLKQILRMPQLYAVGFVWGIYNWTNYWDFIIYFVVTVITIIAINLVTEGMRKTFLYTLIMSAVVAIIGVIAALPFTLNFESIFKGVAFAQNHSKIYQLLVLWGLPASVSVVFIVFFLIAWRRSGLMNINAADIYVFILSCCAMGLVAIPEVVYVRDIYEETNARANTMFKLTYQAYIMFGICSGYVLSALLAHKSKVIKGISITAIVLNILTIGYFFNGGKAWFGTWSNPSLRSNLNALTFLDEEEFSTDKDAITYLKEQVEAGEIDADAVILESPGDSYTSAERVSVVTGMSTVGGWLVHEWLWRDSYEGIKERWDDIDAIYSGEDTEGYTVEELLDFYNVKYIFWGQEESKRYGSDAVDNITKLGKVIYEDESTKIIEVNAE